MYCVFRGQRSVRYCTAEVFFAFNDPCFASDLNLKPLSPLAFVLLSSTGAWIGLDAVVTDHNVILPPDQCVCVCVSLFGGME